MKPVKPRVFYDAINTSKATIVNLPNLSFRPLFKYMENEIVLRVDFDAIATTEDELLDWEGVKVSPDGWLQDDWAAVMRSSSP